MNLLQRFSRYVAPLFGALLLCANSTTYADDLADAHKLFRQGSHSQALEKTNAYLASNPKDAQARFLKGLILTEQNDIPAAIGIFSALTEDYPELPEPYNNLAVLYASQGDYDKAKRSLEKAIRTHPSYATAHENLGDIYAKMASQAYDRALKLDRGNTATQTKLAMIQDLFAQKPENRESAPTEVSAPVRTTAITPVKPAATSPAKPQAVATAAPVVARQSEKVKPAVPPVSKKSDGQGQQLNTIVKTVKAWAAAWSAQNVEEYLSFYSDDFNPGGNETRQSWEATRRSRVSGPKFIEVSLGKATVKFIDDRHASVRFRQSYRASHHKSHSNKTLKMVKVGEKWLIQEEISK